MFDLNLIWFRVEQNKPAAFQPEGLFQIGFKVQKFFIQMKCFTFFLLVNHIHFGWMVFTNFLPTYLVEDAFEVNMLRWRMQCKGFSSSPSISETTIRTTRWLQLLPKRMIFLLKIWEIDCLSRKSGNDFEVHWKYIYRRGIQVMGDWKYIYFFAHLYLKL